MYYNHKLRTDLQEWKNYLYKINYKDYKDEFRFFFQKLDSEKQILSILKNVVDSYPLTEYDISTYMKSLSSRGEILYQNKEHNYHIPYIFVIGLLTIIKHLMIMTFLEKV